MHSVRLDWLHPVDISIPVLFSGERTRAWGISPSTQEPWRDGKFVGEIAEGGTVNCREMRIVAHSAGTHTECVGHIVADPITMTNTALRPLSLALLLTVPLQTLGASGDTYGGMSQADDQVVCSAALRRALESAETVPRSEFSPTAIVLRVASPDATLVGRDWSNSNPPYLTDQAVDVIRHAGFLDILLDIPSIDREWDGGGLPSHHRWWDLPAGVQHLNGPASSRTITEMIQVPASLADGWYGLLLQIPAIASDAVPSRPLLYPLIATEPAGFFHV